MVRSITPLENIPECRISLKGKKDFRKVVADDGELLIKTDGTSYGFRLEETKRGNPKYTLPLQIPEATADALYEVAKKLGDVEYSPVYEMEDGGFLVYVRVPMNAGGLVFANIHDKSRKPVKPQDKTGVMMQVRAIVKVESLRVGGEKPKLQLSLVQAEVEDVEMVYEDFLG